MPGVPIAKAEAGAAPAPRFREPSPEELAKLRAAARVLDPEVIQHTPEQFDNATKNPCFTDKDGQFRCVLTQGAVRHSEPARPPSFLRAASARARRCPARSPRGYRVLPLGPLLPGPAQHDPRTYDEPGGVP